MVNLQLRAHAQLAILPFSELVKDKILNREV